MYDWSQFGNMSVASTLSPKEWLHKWYGEVGFAETIANTLNNWNVSGKSNNVYNRLMMEGILNILLMRITSTGDMEYHPNVQMILLSNSPLDRKINALTIQLRTKDADEIFVCRVATNPHTGIWAVV